VRRVRNLRPAADGRFSVSGLPPGDYLIGAVTDVQNGEWNDPDFLAILAGAAVRVSLAEGVMTTQDLRLSGGQ